MAKRRVITLRRDAIACFYVALSRCCAFARIQRCLDDIAARRWHVNSPYQGSARHDQDRGGNGASQPPVHPRLCLRARNPFRRQRTFRPWRINGFQHGLVGLKHRHPFCQYGILGQRIAHFKGAFLLECAIDIGVQVLVADEVAHVFAFRSAKEMISAEPLCNRLRSRSRALARRDITVPSGISSSSAISR